MLEKGKMYLCLACPYDNFTEGEEYLAITDDELIDKYGNQVQIRNDNCRFKKAEPAQLPAKLIQSAKQVCNRKITDAIFEFEKETGLNVSDIEFNSRNSFGITEKWVSIIISL